MHGRVTIRVLREDSSMSKDRFLFVCFNIQVT